MIPKFKKFEKMFASIPRIAGVIRHGLLYLHPAFSIPRIAGVILGYIAVVLTPFGIPRIAGVIL